MTEIANTGVADAPNLLVFGGLLLMIVVGIVCVGYAEDLPRQPEW